MSNARTNKNNLQAVKEYAGAVRRTGQRLMVLKLCRLSMASSEGDSSLRSESEMFGWGVRQHGNGEIIPA
jgi:hypothetical protein